MMKMFVAKLKGFSVYSKGLQGERNGQNVQRQHSRSQRRMG
jgi:hypothetical protein